MRCSGWCGCSFPGVAVCQCVWLVSGLCWLVIDEEVVIHTVVVGGLLCFLCVQLDALQQLCICPLDGVELHVTYCGFEFQGVVVDDLLELEWYRSPEHCFLDFAVAASGAGLHLPAARSGPFRHVLLSCPPVSNWPGGCLPELAGTVWSVPTSVVVGGGMGIWCSPGVCLYLWGSTSVPASRGGTAVQAVVGHVMPVGVLAAGRGRESRGITRSAAHVAGGS